MKIYPPMTAASTTNAHMFPAPEKLSLMKNMPAVKFMFVAAVGTTGVSYVSSL